MRESLAGARLLAYQAVGMVKGLSSTPEKSSKHWLLWKCGPGFQACAEASINQSLLIQRLFQPNLFLDQNPESQGLTHLPETVHSVKFSLNYTSRSSFLSEKLLNSWTQMMAHAIKKSNDRSFQLGPVFVFNSRRRR